MLRQRCWVKDTRRADDSTEYSPLERGLRIACNDVHSCHSGRACESSTVERSVVRGGLEQCYLMNRSAAVGSGYTSKHVLVHMKGRLQAKGLGSKNVFVSM